MVTEMQIKDKVGTDQRWAERAVVVLFEHQTADEQVHGAAIHKNGIGFNGVDADILSSFAKWLKAGERHHLSAKQLAIAHKKLPKYSNQLLRIACGEA